MNALEFITTSLSGISILGLLGFVWRTSSWKTDIEGKVENVRDEVETQKAKVEVSQTYQNTTNVEIAKLTTEVKGMKDLLKEVREDLKKNLKID